MAPLRNISPLSRDISSVTKPTAHHNHFVGRIKYFSIHRSCIQLWYSMHHYPPKKLFQMLSLLQVIVHPGFIVTTAVLHTRQHHCGDLVTLSMVKLKAAVLFPRLANQVLIVIKRNVPFSKGVWLWEDCLELYCFFEDNINNSKECETLQSVNNYVHVVLRSTIYCIIQQCHRLSFGEDRNGCDEIFIYSKSCGQFRIASWESLIGKSSKDVLTVSITTYSITDKSRHQNPIVSYSWHKYSDRER